MLLAATIERRSDHQLDRARAGLHQRRHRLGGGFDSVEVQPGDRRTSWLHDRLEDCLGDEAERSLRSNQEALEDLDRFVGVQERAEPVAGGVLDPELLADPLGELLVAADLVSDLGEAVCQIRLGLCEPLGCVRRGLSITVPDGSTKVRERTVL